MTDLLNMRKRLLGPSVSLSYDKPLHIVRGRGVYLYDDKDREYLDCVNNICHVGHCHPRVVDALCKQASILNTNTRYLHQTIVDLAQRLAATLPQPLSVAYFVCSGSEANELAVRLARTYTQRDGAVVLEWGYHGNTSTLVDLSPYKFDRAGGRGAKPHVRKALLADGYRGPYKYTDADIVSRYAASVEACFMDLAGAGTPAGFVLAESLPGCGGQIEFPMGYLAKVAEIAHRHGALYIADEVQVGLGRMGTDFWGFQTQDALPDIVTIGKPMGNGHPLAAVITTPEIAHTFANGMEYFNSFGGNPVSCAVGMTVLDVIENEGLQANALRVGDYLKTGLGDLARTCSLIGDVRGRGLYLGVELVRDRDTLAPATAQAHDIVNAMRERGVLLSTDGPHENVLKIKPPLVFADEHADRLIGTLGELLSGYR